MAVAREIAKPDQGDDRLSISRFSRSRWRLVVIACLLMLLMCTAPAHAVHHLIRPGDDWQHLEPRLRPGDEIILMPGRHRDAAFEKIAGTARKPIIIRSADAANPSTIVADREGIRVRQPTNLIIKDVIITDASINGLTLGGASGPEGIADSVVGENVTVRNVVILRTGPRGLRHGICAQWISQLRIEDCRIEGWGGSAIELIGCRDTRIARCNLVGLHDHGQLHGVRTRAGCEGVEIEECRTENAGSIALCLGAASAPQDFPPGRLDRASTGTVAEATRVRVQRNIIIASQSAVAMMHVDECSIRNNTLVRQRRCAFALLTEHTDPIFSAGVRIDIGRNLIMWQPGDLSRLVEVSGAVDPTKLTFDANLWWSPDLAEQKTKLGEVPGRHLSPQVMDVDPVLDDHFAPTAPAADGFGF